MAPISRRNILQTSGAALVAGLAGCSTSLGSNPPTLDRLVFRSDTGESEPISVLKTYAPRDGSTKQSNAVYEAHSSGDLTIVDVDDGPGFYNVHAEAQNHRSVAFRSFNSHREGAPSYDLQFEFVVRENGTLYSNAQRTGGEISIPGPSR